MQKSAIYAVLTLAALAVVIISAAGTAIAQQATMQFPVERDAGMLGWDNHDGWGDPPEFDPDIVAETEEFSNHGYMAAIRGRKTTQHAAIMDWNTDEIGAFINANVDTSQPVSWTFNIYPLDAPGSDVQIETLESLNDWAEGNGGFFDWVGDGNDGSFENFNWAEGTLAATTSFAQTAFVNTEIGQFLDEDNSLPWIDNDSGTGGIDDNQYAILGRPDNWAQGLRIPDYVNSELLLSADMGDAAFDFTYASVPLDDELIALLLGDPDNRGIILGPESLGGNWRFWTREGSGVDPGEPITEPSLLPGPVAPFLELTYTPKETTTSADFNSDGAIDLLDIDLLYVELKSGGNDPDFDLDADGLVNDADLQVWLTEAGAASGFAGAIPPGDANLDGAVDAADLNAVGVNWQSMSVTSWGEGDFNYDGAVNAPDLNVLGVNWQNDATAGAASTASVPEPTSGLLLFVGIAVWAGQRRRVEISSR